MIAAVIGLAAYPVVRHLTRRLERLRRGVDAWGGGALATRVPDDGSDEVAAVARSFNKAADHIERLLTAHRALLANASHELRSPLARLRMAIDLYEGSRDEGHKREIVQNLGELDALVEEILLASRLDHIEKLDHAEPVDLLALAAEEGAKSGVAVSGTPAIVSGDPRLLTRLVRNLIQNAERHGAPPVSVDVKSDGGTVRLAVRDHGAGVPEGERSRVFEPFYRPSGRSETSGGWGLGLSLVRQIARHHGATMHYEAPDDGGARFVVEFPAAGR
jgi:signal transduction histidine kinase